VDNNFFTREAARARAQASELRRDLGLPDRYFLYAGRLVPGKGVFDLLAAYAALDLALRQRIALVFVGDGSAEAALKSRTTQICPGTIQFTGFAQREQLAAYYALAETLIFPTHSDPWGLVVNEAMACGLPVVTTIAAGCTPDLVRDGWNGYVLPVAATAKLSEAMSRFARDLQLAPLMGARSAQHIERNSPQACAAGFAQAAAAQWETS
jgi:glycosyltransferase involved in cell wall biosynthesis